jgi:hypothetical protein
MKFCNNNIKYTVYEFTALNSINWFNNFQAKLYGGNSYFFEMSLQHSRHATF